MMSMVLWFRQRTTDVGINSRIDVVRQLGGAVEVVWTVVEFLDDGVVCVVDLHADRRRSVGWRHANVGVNGLVFIITQLERAVESFWTLGENCDGSIELAYCLADRWKSRSNSVVVVTATIILFMSHQSILKVLLLALLIVGS